jgi:hypothetical protein
VVANNHFSDVTLPILNISSRENVVMHTLYYILPPDISMGTPQYTT